MKPKLPDKANRSQAWYYAKAQHPNLIQFDRLVEMFHTAGKSSTLSRIVFHLPLQPYVTLILTAKDSIDFSMWQIEIVARFPYNGAQIYLGTVDLEGILRPSLELKVSDKKLKQEVWKVLAQLRGENPEEVITKIGKQSGYCTLCNRQLTDKESIRRGVGPVCAARFGISLTPAIDLNHHFQQLQKGNTTNDNS